MPKNQECRMGKWKKTEHDRFMKALAKYGKNWALVQQAVKTRTLAQVRSHSQKLFLSMTSKQISLFEEQINHRYEMFCNDQKGNGSSKRDKKSELKPAEVKDQNQQQFCLFPLKNEDSNVVSCMEKQNDGQKADQDERNQASIEDLKQGQKEDSQKEALQTQKESSSPTVQQNFYYNYTMLPCAQMLSFANGSLPFIFWLPC